MGVVRWGRPLVLLVLCSQYRPSHDHVRGRHDIVVGRIPDWSLLVAQCAITRSSTTKFIETPNIMIYLILMLMRVPPLPLPYEVPSSWFVHPLESAHTEPSNLKQG